MKPNFLEIKSKIKALKCAIIVPTYNNATTIELLIKELLLYSDDIIVVNDGSTDQTSKILSDFENINIISFQINKGKGCALRAGFEKAYGMGYDYAITIDSDGQHFPENILDFINKIEENPDSFIIGARNMEQAGVPQRSSFGNKFSNFWFWVETGINLPDTQSGYRLYPLKAIHKLTFYTTKFEFEIEVMVRLAWANVQLLFIPVKIYYAPKISRISHFRPIKDFSRISVLNTVLVTLSLLYFAPLRFIKSLSKEKVKHYLKKNLFDSEESNFKKSLSIALGTFIGIVPIWGYQIITVVLLTHLFKLNKVLAVLASNISIPPLTPFILYFSYKIGVWTIKKDTLFPDSAQLDFNFLKQNLFTYLIGSFVFATFSALTLGLISYLFLTVFRRNTVSRTI